MIFLFSHVFPCFFRSGHVKEANKKDCILIIDPETGEITLERLSAHILVKKTRPERPIPGSGSCVVGSSNPGANGSTSRPGTPTSDQLFSNGGKRGRRSPGEKNLHSSLILMRNLSRCEIGAALE